MPNQINTFFGGNVLISINNGLLSCICRYREIKYPENIEKVVIYNNSGLQAEVKFSFRDDNQGTTFLLDPPAMSLQPDQKQVWVRSLVKKNRFDFYSCYFLVKCFSYSTGVDSVGLPN